MNRQLGGHAPVVAVAVAAKVVDEAIGEEGKLQSRVCLQRRHAIAIVSHLGLFIVYTLRVILSVAIVPMQKQYHWTDAEKGIILSSFFAGYLFLQLAGGYLAIHYGPKLVFGLGVLIPSILTALTPPVAWSIPMLVTLRVLTGLGESVTYPSLHCLLGAWSPKSGECITHCCVCGFDIAETRSTRCRACLCCCSSYGVQSVPRSWGLRGPALILERRLPFPWRARSSGQERGGRVYSISQQEQVCCGRFCGGW